MAKRYVDKRAIGVLMEGSGMIRRLAIEQNNINGKCWSTTNDQAILKLRFKLSYRFYIKQSIKSYLGYICLPAFIIKNIKKINQSISDLGLGHILI
jgi:hypothetical protein